mmetsp:Transcript_23122/g.17539  ORF Transcript_23122/g.17539 Transcript_23122/m.17539 type:complete len:151 (+) Transcript_23122:215-667(+)
MAMNQAKEREEVEQAHILEYQEFNKNWDEVMHKTEEDHTILIKQLEEKHVHELEENRAKLEQSLPTLPKASAELLNNKKIQEQLARQKEYAEAHKVQVKCQEMERDELEKHMQMRHKKIVAAEAALITKQQNEMSALKKKLEAIQVGQMK